MVTAGIFMVARMSPLFELSETALAFVLFIGATTAFFTGLIGIVQNDIKRVVAYSTLSQLGYMTVALGVSAYAGAVFHLMTHAFFKALLFLAAGSVIIGMHHEQDMRKMGGLRKYMPITWITSLIGTLALVGTPFFSGYFSKDSIILATEAAAEHGGWVQVYAKWCVLLGVFVTAFYSFRLLYLTFHGKERFRDAHAVHADDHAQDDESHDSHGEAAAAHDDHHGPHEPHESPWVVTLPLILLAIPSIFIGFFTVGPMLFGDFFREAIFVRPEHATLAEVAHEVWHGDHGWVSAAIGFGMHFVTSPVFWLAFAGFALATLMYLVRPELADRAAKVFALPKRILENKYGFDTLWIKGFARGGVKLGRAFWKGGDTAIIDGVLVDGSAAVVDRIATLSRGLQSGRLYHYAFAMILGLIALLGALIWSLRA
jgi:NADH-quinone oxidoreductase subunit L